MDSIFFSYPLFGIQGSKSQSSPVLLILRYSFFWGAFAHFNKKKCNPTGFQCSYSALMWNRVGPADSVSRVTSCPVADIKDVH